MTSPAKSLTAGALRHRISIDRQDHTQDETSGAVQITWTQIATGIPAKVEPLSGRDFVAAAQASSSISARIIIRHRAGLNHAMRIRHGATAYRIRAILPDNRSGQEWQTILVESE